MTGKDPAHWLHRFTAREWIATAMTELARAEGAYAANDARGGLAGLRRAAGMALNGALVVSPNEAWGRTYMEHLGAVAKDASLPREVTESARALLEAKAPGPALVGLRSKSGDDRLVEAAKTVMAHAYAISLHAKDESE